MRHRSITLLLTASFVAMLGLNLPAAESSSSGVQTFKESELKPADKDSYSRADRRFIVAVLNRNHNETVIAQLVAERATSREVKALARQMEADLSDSSQQVRTLAKDRGIPTPDIRSESGDLKTWNEKKPDSLDQDYLKRAQDALKDLVGLFENAAEKSDDAEVAAFAKKVLPALREQQRKAGQAAPVVP